MKKQRSLLALSLAILLLCMTLASCFTDLPPEDLTDADISTEVTAPDGSLTDGNVTDTDTPATDPPETIIPVNPIVTDPPVETTTAPSPSPETLSGQVVFVSSTGYSEYRIIYPASASAKLKFAAEDLAAYLNSTFPGAAVKAIPDTGKANADVYEILVGNVDRNEVPKSEAGKSEYTVKISGKKAVLCGFSDTAVINAVNYFKYEFASGIRASAPVNFSYTCSSTPRLASQTPEKYYYYEDVYTPSLMFSFVCTPGVDTAKTKLIINDSDVTSYAAWGSGIVTLKNQKFAAGSYNVWLILTDTQGNVLVHSSAFACGDGSVMNLYSGELHSHTSESDGVGTIEQAYIYARDTAKLDFFAVTDHSNSIDLAKYKTKHIPTADLLNDPGRYITFYGYEQTYNFASGYFGHLNVINYTNITQRAQALDSFYEQMSKQKSVAVMFNHPGYKWGNFLEYSLYSEKVDSVLNLTEIKGASYDTEYSLALTNGWHVSPMYNEDNHTNNWGAASEACGFALAPALTRQNIMEAFEKNRTYTTLDKTLQVYYQINGEWMGSRLNNPDKLRVKVELTTKKSIGLGIIQLIAEDNIVVETVNAGRAKTYTWELEIDPLFDYYYIRLEGAAVWCITAPIWIENREELTIESLDFSVLENNQGANDYLMQTIVKNNSKISMTDVKVDYYLTTSAGLNYKTSKPALTVEHGTIAAGATTAIEGAVRYLISTPRVVAVVTGKIGDKNYLATTFMHLSNIYITEIVALTKTEGTVSNPYDYFEIYNNSDTAINLASYSLQYYPKAGAAAADLAANTWKLTGTVQPFSTMLIWVKSSSSNTKSVSDFNALYGTSLELGKDIVIISGVDIPSSNAVQIELLNGTTIIGRVWYNWANSTNVAANRSVDFAYPLKYTETARLTASLIPPTPGKVTAAQVPKTIK